QLARQFTHELRAANHRCRRCPLNRCLPARHDADVAGVGGHTVVGHSPFPRADLSAATWAHHAAFPLSDARRSARSTAHGFTPSAWSSFTLTSALTRCTGCIGTRIRARWSDAAANSTSRWT